MAMITELRPIKRRVQIFVDGRSFACVPRDWLDELELHQYDDVDPDDLGGAIAARQFEGEYAYALELLAGAMRSRRQVLAKLAARGCCAATLEQVARRLEESGLIDDAAYAQRQLELSNRRGKGQRAAVSALIAKGVDADTARRSLEGWDHEAEQRAAFDAAYKYMRRRWDGDERHVRMLTYAALARRGYQSGLARQAVEHALQRLRAELEADE